jgi:hypothetical protein
MKGDDMYDKNEINSQQTFVNLTEIVEHEFCDLIDEDDFFSLMDKFNIDVLDFQKKKRLMNQNNIKRFNKFIYKCKIKLGIDIYASLIYIEKRYVQFSKLIDILDNNNKQILIREMAEKYNIKIQKNNMGDFLIY